MNEEYVKTLVIDDPNYRPGDLLPGAPGPTAPAPAAPTPALPDADLALLADDLPDFDDTSWLT